MYEKVKSLQDSNPLKLINLVLCMKVPKYNKTKKISKFVIDKFHNLQ